MCPDAYCYVCVLTLQIENLTKRADEAARVARILRLQAPPKGEGHNAIFVSRHVHVHERESGAEAPKNANLVTRNPILGE